MFDRRAAHRGWFGQGGMVLAIATALCVLGLAVAVGCRRATPPRPVAAMQPYVCDWTRPGRTATVTDGGDLEMLRKLGVSKDRMVIQSDPSAQNLGPMQVVLPKGTALRICVNHFTVYVNAQDKKRYDLVDFRSYRMSGPQVMRWVGDLPEKLAKDAAEKARALVNRPGPRMGKDAALFDVWEGNVRVTAGLQDLGSAVPDPFLVSISVQY